MKEIKKSNSVVDQLSENENIKPSPGKIFTMKDVLSTKDSKVETKNKIKGRMDSTVRVHKETRIKLNLLTKFSGEDVVDDIINRMMDDFIINVLSKEDKKLFLAMVDKELNSNKS